MKISGSNVVAHPVGEVWDALLDPRVLVATIPGCERLETTGQDEYAMTVTAGVAAIKGTYAGSCALSDLREHESLVMRLSGAGAPGTIDAVVDVAFEDLGDEGTKISYEADATVGGMVGGVGQRMLASVSKRMAAEFFGNVAGTIGAPVPTTEAVVSQTGTDGTTAGEPTTVFAAPGRAVTPGGGSSDDFYRGVAVGAGLVLLGVAVGAVLGRRR